MNKKADNHKDEPNMLTVVMLVIFFAAVVFGMVMLALYIHG